MTNQAQSFQLPANNLLGQWLVKRSTLWQIELLDESDFDKFCSERGLRSMFVWKSLRTVWQLGLVNADLVASSQELDLPGLIKLGQDHSGRYLYADERVPAHRPEGWAGVEPELPASPDDLKLSFHPYRHYVIARIRHILQLIVSDVQVVYGPKAYHKFVDDHVKRFQEFTGRPEFTEEVREWNRVVALAVSAEPIFHSQIFGYLRLRHGLDSATWYAQADQHWADVKKCYEAVGLEKVKEWYRNLCMTAERLDPNTEAHVALRLTDGDWRWQSITGNLGGAMCLLAIAETLRRGAEKGFEIALPEEDEWRSGPMKQRVKKERFGADRIIDATRTIKNRYLRSLGLDYGVRVRWYVEGNTELGALEAVVRDFSGIELINLAGNVAAARGKGVAFRDSLRSDIRAEIFSFVTVDNDRSENVRALQKAAQDDEMCGMFFISIPDFELQNFTLTELEIILWELALERGTNSQARSRLDLLALEPKSGSDVLDMAKAAWPELIGVSKGVGWGRKLGNFAWDHPEAPEIATGEQKLRPIVDAIHEALRACGLDYQLSRSKTRVDPATGRPVRRVARG